MRQDLDSFLIAKERHGRRFRTTMACFILVILWPAFCIQPAWAHKVTIFAWVEGDTVHTQSKFSGGKRAKSSTVVVYDKEGNLLLEGQTDENGEFSFKVPKKTELKVALKASMGHLAEWTIPAEEISASGGIAESPSAEAPVETPQEARPAEAVKTEVEPATPVAVGLSREEIQRLVNESLDRKLGPVISMLADSLDRGPTLSEVMGGIGYIFGLVGVALYFSTRKKGK